MTDVRDAIVAWARWGVANHARFNYSEGADRGSWLGDKPGTLPITTDCSGFVTLSYKWAGAADPNGQGYRLLGYTGTLLTVGRVIPLAEVLPGDVIVYGPGTGWHTALVLEAGADPLTASHGQQGDPSLVYVSQDGRQPQRYLRFDTTAAYPIAYPPGYPVPRPPEQKMIEEVHVTCNTRQADGRYQGVTAIAHPFAKVDSWSVEQGEGNNDIIAGAEPVGDGSAKTNITAKGAAQGQVVTVRVDILA